MPQKKLNSAKVQRLLQFFLSAESRKAWSEGLSEVELTRAHGKSHLVNLALRAWFEKIYAFHKMSFTAAPPTIELGSGGSQLKQVMPDLVTTDILPLPGLDAVVDALNMPYQNSSVANLTLVNVLHHLPQPLRFFSEANRVLKEGGRLVFTEPYVSLVSYPIYKFVHHEPCEMKKNIFDLGADAQALIDSNQAMPTQLIRHHFAALQAAAPDLTLKKIRYHSSLIYFLSGGVNYRPLVPFTFWKLLERADSLVCLVFGRWVASFFTVVFEKSTHPTHRREDDVSKP